MLAARRTLLIAACLLSSMVSLAAPSHGQDFARYGEDEEACRRAGTAAIKGAVGPQAAQRYDTAHGQCMAAHGRMRQFGGGPNQGPPGTPYAPNVHSGEFPDAFYSIPYATPGYGYDGFSY